jgi:hypothetical protein
MGDFFGKYRLICTISKRNIPTQKIPSLGVIVDQAQAMAPTLNENDFARQEAEKVTRYRQQKPASQAQARCRCR